MFVLSSSEAERAKRAEEDLRKIDDTQPSYLQRMALVVYIAVLIMGAINHPPHLF